MPVMEYCAFLAALCLNCGATGPAAPQVTVQWGATVSAGNQQHSGRNISPSSGLFWTWACGLWAFCSALLGRGTWLSTLPCEAHTCSLLQSCAVQRLLTCLSMSTSPVPGTAGCRTVLVLERFQHLSELIMLSVSLLLCCWTGMIHAYSVVFPL